MDIGWRMWMDYKSFWFWWSGGESGDPHPSNDVMEMEIARLASLSCQIITVDGLAPTRLCSRFLIQQHHPHPDGRLSPISYHFQSFLSPNWACSNSSALLYFLFCFVTFGWSFCSTLVLQQIILYFLLLLFLIG